MQVSFIVIVYRKGHIIKNTHEDIEINVAKKSERENAYPENNSAILLFKSIAREKY